MFVPVYQDKVNDVVTFGPSPRPSSGGAFTEDGTLNNAKPSGTQSISRAFTGNTPIDTDKESDWSQKVTTPGAPTGP